jgi:hypothetical protein
MDVGSAQFFALLTADDVCGFTALRTMAISGSDTVALRGKPCTLQTVRQLSGLLATTSPAIFALAKHLTPPNDVVLLTETCKRIVIAYEQWRRVEKQRRTSGFTDASEAGAEPMLSVDDLRFGSTAAHPVLLSHDLQTVQFNGFTPRSFDHKAAPSSSATVIAQRGPPKLPSSERFAEGPSPSRCAVADSSFLKPYNPFSSWSVNAKPMDTVCDFPMPPLMPGTLALAATPSNDVASGTFEPSPKKSPRPRIMVSPRAPRPSSGASVKGTWSASHVARIADVERPTHDSVVVLWDGAESAVHVPAPPPPPLPRDTWLIGVQHVIPGRRAQSARKSTVETTRRRQPPPSAVLHAAAQPADLSPLRVDSGAASCLAPTAPVVTDTGIVVQPKSATGVRNGSDLAHFVRRETTRPGCPATET